MTAQIQNFVLTLGQLVAPMVPCVFSHCLLLTDCAYLRHLRKTRAGCWFLAGVSGSEAFRHTSAYDLCFDVGQKKFYVDSTWKVGRFAGTTCRNACWDRKNWRRSTRCA